MSTQLSFSVLLLNRRRQTVKIRPNECLLKIVEEVCSKQKYDSCDYDLKFQNRTLDLTVMVRYSGLPNNALLEIVPKQKQTEEGAVTVGLQLETGDRLLGTFLPKDTLWNIVVQLCPSEPTSEPVPVVIYMQREIVGISKLKETTLKSLGISSGRAVLRYMHRLSETCYQANVSVNLPHKPPKEEHDSLPLEHNSAGSIPAAHLTNVNELIPSHQDPKQNSCNSIDSIESYKSNIFGVRNVLKDVPSKSSNSGLAVETPKLSVDTEECSHASVENIPTSPVRSSIPEKASLKTVRAFGKRNMMVLNLNLEPERNFEELPDDFFNVTVEDARLIMRDLKKRRQELEESVLSTNEIRKQQEQQTKNSLIEKYNKTILRVKFPNRTVLQATFSPEETVNDVMDSINNCLSNPEVEYYLFTAPPKVILNPNSTLFEAGCVPSALLYFGLVDRSQESQVEYLKPHLYSHFANFADANLAAQISRGLVNFGAIEVAEEELGNASTQPH